MQIFEESFTTMAHRSPKSVHIDHPTFSPTVISWHETCFLVYFRCTLHRFLSDLSKMKKLILVSAVLAAFTANIAQAEEEKPDHELTFNAAITSDYRYRGISQTRLEPALQGGTDYIHNPSGLYVGSWMSTIKWIKDIPSAGSTPIEWDIYGGNKGELIRDLTYDIGILTYVYANNKLGNVASSSNANTTELYGQLAYGPSYIKYSHAVTNLFGFVDSKNSGYLDVGANVEAGNGFTVNLHAGHQKVRNNSAFSYTDWKVGVTKDFGVVTGAIALVGTNNDNYRGPGPDFKNLGKNGIVVTASKTF